MTYFCVVKIWFVLLRNLYFEICLLGLSQIDLYGHSTVSIALFVPSTGVTNIFTTVGAIDVYNHLCVRTSLSPIHIYLYECLWCTLHKPYTAEIAVKPENVKMAFDNKYICEKGYFWNRKYSYFFFSESYRWKKKSTFYPLGFF